MIDWMRVAELRDEIGADDFDEVVELFLGEVQECLASLDETKGAAQMEAEMHLLKGSALNLGFETFANLCQTAETAASKGDLSGLDIGAVHTLFAQSKTHFEQSLPQMVA